MPNSVTHENLPSNQSIQSNLTNLNSALVALKPSINTLYKIHWIPCGSIVSEKNTICHHTFSHCDLFQAENTGRGNLAPCRLLRYVLRSFRQSDEFVCGGDYLRYWICILCEQYSKESLMTCDMFHSSSYIWI